MVEIGPLWFIAFVCSTSITFWVQLKPQRKYLTFRPIRPTEMTSLSIIISPSIRQFLFMWLDWSCENTVNRRVTSSVKVDQMSQSCVEQNNLCEICYYDFDNIRLTKGCWASLVYVFAFKVLKKNSRILTQRKNSHPLSNPVHIAVLILLKFVQI